MIQYIYFVKCPDCEDEPFDFFNDAKNYALGCLSKKPIITQIEVNRNDFGECTDSKDLGTIWSWEDLMKETDAEPAISIFTKDDLNTSDSDHDPEFDNLDNSLDMVPDNFCKPVPPEMTIADLVEAMEENEDEVECKWCEELFDKSECRFEVDLGWLCSRCEAAIKSRGETLTFRENSYWDFLDEDTKNLEETISKRDTVDLEYEALTITVDGPKRDVDDWDEVEHTGRYTLTLDKADVALVIWENFIEEEDVTDVPGGLKTLENEEDWKNFLETHFDILFEKYYQEILDYYKEEAEESFRDNYSYSDYLSDHEAASADARYDAQREEQLFESNGSTKSMLEELENADTYRQRLSFCPECGTDSFDQETGICISCGFN